MAWSIRPDSSDHSTTSQCRSSKPDPLAACTKRPMPAEGSRASTTPSAFGSVGTSGRTTRATSQATRVGV